MSFEQEFKDTEEAFKHLSKTRPKSAQKFAADRLNENLSIIYYACLTSDSLNKSKYIDLGFKYDICIIVCRVLRFAYKNLVEQFEAEDRNDQILNKTLQITVAIMGITRYFSNYSAVFCHQFHQADGVEILFQYLKIKTLIEKYSMQKSNSDFVDKFIPKIVRCLIGCLVNMSKYMQNYIEKWKEQESTEYFLKLSDKLKDVEDCQLACFVILANSGTCEDIERNIKFKTIALGISKVIGHMATRLSTVDKINIKRHLVQVSEECNELEEIITVDVKGSIWHLVELLMALYKLSVVDKIKQYIYFDCHIKMYLKSILIKGNRTESEYGLKILWQFCFDELICEDLFETKDLYSALSNLEELYKENKSLELNIKGIYWLVGRKILHKVDDKFLKIKRNEKNPKNHIMISYERDYKDYCLRIKKELEIEGHIVWMDINEVNSSSLESMSKAIESSKCVLMCITEKYKQSSLCRAEAEYAVELNKPIVPIIFQNDYKPDGWFIDILGSKIVINFTKYDFEESMKRTKIEINNFQPNPKNEFKSNTSLPNEPKSLSIPVTKILEFEKKIPVIEDWTESQVKNWINEKKFHSVIVKNVSPCNGLVLSQLMQMHQEAPEFFYTSITSNGKIPTKDIAYFVSELKKLLK